MQDYITQSIQEGIRLKENILNNRQMLTDIETVGNLIVQALRQGHKVLLCGNGGSAADAQHIAAELVGRFVTEREGLPAIAGSAALSLAALGAVGMVTSLFNGRHPAFSALRQIVFGGVAAAVTFGVGALFGTAV